MKENKALVIGIIFVLLLVLACVLTYNLTSAHYKKQAKVSPTTSDKQSQQEDDIYKLRVCINKSDTKEDQTACFRKQDQGLLPSPTLDDINLLPDLY